MTDWHDQKTRQTRRPRRLEEVKTTTIGFPIAWVIIGALSGLIIIGLVGLGVVNIIRKQSITPTPATIPGVAPTEPIADVTPGETTPTIPPVVTLEPTPTPVPTETPLPTVPVALEPGVYAKVVETGDAGLSIRSGPGTNTARLKIVPEDSILIILDGPRADENLQEFIWWYVRDEDGTEGWSVQDFLTPTVPPNSE